MNLNRIKKNITNRDWSSKSKETNIKYIKQKLNQFNLPIPKYLSNGKLTTNEIKSNTNKLLKAIEKQIDINRKAVNNRSYDNAMKSLQKTVEKHNKLVYKKLGYLVNKYNMNENQLNYMIGMDVNVNGYKHDNKFTFSRTNSQFQIIDLENFYANDIETIRNRIRQINKFNERLTNKNIDKEVKNSLEAKAQIEEVLKNYEQEGYLNKSEVDYVKNKFNKMNGIQQEFFYKMVVTSFTKQKYIIADDELESFQLSLKNKWNTLLNRASEF